MSEPMKLEDAIKEIDRMKNEIESLKGEREKYRKALDSAYLKLRVTFILLVLCVVGICIVLGAVGVVVAVPGIGSVGYSFNTSTITVVPSMTRTPFATATPPLANTLAVTSTPQRSATASTATAPVTTPAPALKYPYKTTIQAPVGTNLGNLQGANGYVGELPPTSSQGSDFFLANGTEVEVLGIQTGWAWINCPASLNPCPGKKKVWVGENFLKEVRK